MKRTVVAIVSVVAVALSVFVMVSDRDGDPLEPDPRGRQPDHRIAAALRSRESVVTRDHDPIGTLRLEGLVVDAVDHPVANAKVTLSSNPPRVVTTSEDGSFAIDKLVPGAYTLVARTDLASAGPVTTKLSETSDPVTLRLTPAAALEVTIINAAERGPIADATVEVRGLDLRSARTGALGSVRIGGVTPGIHEVAAWAPGFARSFAVVRVPVGNTANTVAVQVAIALRRGAPVTGTVYDEQGRPVADAMVSYVPTSEWMTHPDPERDAVATRADGRFRFDALPSGTVRFVARTDDSAPGSSSLVTLDGERPRDGVEIRLSPGASIAGRVVDRDGAPVAYARVLVDEVSNGPPGPGSSTLRRQRAADAKGSFSIAGLARRKVRVRAESELATSQAAELDLAADANVKALEIRLEHVGTIAGVVVDSRGRALADTPVSAMSRPDDGARRGFFMAQLDQRTAITDVTGKFTLTGLAAGSYILRAGTAARSRSFDPRFGERQDRIVAETGDTSVRIVVPGTARVSGKIAKTDGSPVTLFSVTIGMGNTTPFVTSDGSFLVDDVPVGDVTLRLSGPEFAATTVETTVVADTTKDVGTIRVVRGRRILGRVVDERATPIVGATVVAGRMLGGTGGSLQSGANLPVGATGTRSAVSDDQGEFILAGVGTQDLAIAAEHETSGRSATQLVRGQLDDSTVTLVVHPFGAVEGTVRYRDQPVDGAIVIATAQSVPSSRFTVTTGADGSFRYDRLAPDRYLIQASVARSRMLGAGGVSQVVDVPASGVTRVALAIPKGSTVHAAIVADGKPPAFAFVRAAQGVLRSTTERDLGLEIAALGAVWSGFAPAFLRGSVVFEDVPPGTLSVCATAFPAEITNPRDAIDYNSRAGDALPVTCAQVQIMTGVDPSVTIAIPTLPAFIPPPEGTSSGSGSAVPKNPP